jgi:ABC-type nitrate/sulfonate/bicarbonate transport system substrate-binding protein
VVNKWVTHMFCIWLSQVRCGHVSPEDRQKNVPSVGQLQLTRSGASLSFFCGIALIILGLLIFSEGAGAEAIRIAYGGTAGYNVPLWVGQEGGYFKKQGFSTELILTQLDIHALLANEVQVVNTAGFVPIQARLQGGDVVIVATSYNFIPYSFVVHKDIRSPSDLKGKRIALSRLGGITELAARLAFERLGLNPKEATFVQAGADAQRIAAVQSGAAAGTVLSPPGLFAAFSQGLRVLVDLGDSGAKYPTAVIAVTRPYLRQNRPVVKRFLMGFIEGLHLYKENKAFTLKVMQKFTKFSNQETLSLSHDYFVRNTSLLPRTDPEGIKNAIPEDKIGGRKVDEFYDNSLIEELINEGFLAKLPTKK